MKVYVVGKALLDGAGEAVDRAWDMQGVFSTEAAAVAACEDLAVKLAAELARPGAACSPGRFFVGPLDLDHALPVEGMPWPGFYYHP